GWLLFFRFLQGISAGLIISCAPAMVTSLYPEIRRSHALGIFTLMFALGSAVGPLIGGTLVAHWGWPAVFWFRAPIALVALLLLRGLPAGGRTRRGERFDIAGALLLAFGIAAMLLAINALPWPFAGALLATGFVAMAATSPFAGWLIGHVAAERVAPFGAMMTGLGLFLISNWHPDTAPGVMVVALVLHGLGMGLFQVAYM